jgi:HAMP domain-containing protein
VIFLFSVTALLLIDEKKKELSQDIYTKARSFGELTTPKIADLYSSLLAQNSFVLFNREIKDVFRKNEDISAIRVANYSGELLYDSVQEEQRAYSGPPRTLADRDLQARVQATLPSFLLESGRVVYLKKNEEGRYESVNENDKPISEISDTDAIVNIVSPFPPNFSVLFDVTYENLRSRVVRTTERIVLLLIFGILLGLGFGWYFSQRITEPIAKLTEGALILGKGDFKARVTVKTHDEVGILADTFNKMAQDLEISMKAMVYKERVAKELEVAARIQKQILPEKLPLISGLDVAAAVIPAVEIGGDCYDFIQVDPDTHLFYISDVTGHGIPSGIVVSIANALIYSYANSPNLRDILINANRVLREKTAQNMFMTLLMLRYRQGNLDYVSAGHPEMLHYHAVDKKVSVEKGGGIALGMVPDISKMLIESSVSFQPGDSIVLYSDGIPEAVSSRGEQYGLQRFKRALNDQGELASAEAIKNSLLADVKQFMGDATQMDDITIVVVRRVS